MMLESMSSASDAAWQSSFDPTLCCPLVSHVPDETVAVNAAYLEAGHARGQYGWPVADAVVPPMQSAQLVCPLEPPVDLPAAHGLQTAALVRCPGVASENLPAPHLVQLAWFELVYWPPAH